MNFNDVWERIKKVTDVKKIVQLSKITGKSQPYISRKKKEGVFHVEWAFAVAQKYGLSTDWIMTGKMPLQNLPAESKGMEESEEPIMKEISEWLDEKIQREPKRREWFEMTFCDNYPDFAQWREQKKEEWCLSNVS